jgi:hypothetical protein
MDLEMSGVPLPHGELLCVLDGGLVRVCVTVTLAVLVDDAEPVMVVEPVGVRLARPELVTETVPELSAVKDALPVGEGVGGAARVAVPHTVVEGLSRRALADSVTDTVDVLLAVEVRVPLGEPEAVKVTRGERECVGDSRAVREGAFTEAVTLGEAEFVLLARLLFVIVTDTVGVLLLVEEADSVFEPPMLREPVADVEGDLLAVMVRVPVGLAVPVRDDVIEPVAVGVRRALPESRGERV